ncbi:MAG: hypothetical protein JWO48_814 [Bryobacterales bacterium]|nr:hypothetical protein [Bryobacterales bacterium]
MGSNSMRLRILVLTGVFGLLAAKAASNGGKLVSHVLERAHQSEPTRAERRLDAIGWASGIKEAERLAREHNRPVFLFTHDGNIATGRC